MLSNEGADNSGANSLTGTGLRLFVGDLTKCVL
jgi:hypothetical protein